MPRKRIEKANEKISDQIQRLQVQQPNDTIQTNFQIIDQFESFWFKNEEDKCEQFILETAIIPPGEANTSILIGKISGRSFVFKIMDRLNENEFKSEVGICKILDDGSKVVQIQAYGMDTILYYRFKHLGTSRVYGAFIVFDLKKNGDLQQFINLDYFTESHALYLFKQMIDCVQYIHSKGVAHLDLKPGQFLVDDDLSSVLLADFGHSVKFLETDKLVNKFNVGTLYFRAPETFLSNSKRQQSNYDPTQADIYSLACTVMVMLTGWSNWIQLQQKCPAEIKFNQYVLNVLIDPTKHIDVPRPSKNCTNLLISMLLTDPNKRPTLQEIRDSDWMKELEFSNDFGKEMAHRHSFLEQQKSDMHQERISEGKNFEGGELINFKHTFGRGISQ